MPFPSPPAPDRPQRCTAGALVAAAALFAWGFAPAYAAEALPATVAAALQRAAIPESAVSIYVERVDALEQVPVAGRAADPANQPPDEVLSPPPPDEALPSPAEAVPLPPPARVIRAAGPGRTQPLLALNADQAMNPASTMKLVTTYAALELLGPAFKWKTVAASSAPLVGSRLEGDLYLRGSGDPGFVLESYWLMLRQLRDRGIRTIRGDLVLDRGLFEAAPYDPAAFDGEPSRPYNVGPDALLVNFNAVTLRFIPDDARRRVRVAIEPPLAGFRLGPVAYARGACADWKTRVAADFSNPGGIAFHGAFPGSCGEQTWNVAILDHRQYVGALFRSLWTELGGRLLGTIRDGAVPADARVLVEHDSPSLAEVVRDINKFSNNVMARELFLSLAAEMLKAPATLERGQRVVRNFYADKGIAMPGLVLDNGSGLSRSERISAHSMARVLEAAWTSPVMPELMSSLPLVGYDGTMRKRLRGLGVAGQAHVKTGSLAEVRSIAGYVLAASGKRYVVVAFVNHPDADRATAAQDALLQWVYDHG